MNQRFSTLASTVVLLGIALPVWAGDVLDRIVATVNNHIILQSEWQDAIRYEAFLSARPLDQVNAEDRKAALDRLIDQELLREQMRSSDFPHASSEVVNNRLQEIRKQYRDTDTDAGWKTAISRY